MTARNPAEIRRMAALYDEGWSCKEIGDEYGLRPGTVWYHLDKLGVEMRPPGEHHKRVDEQLQAVSDNLAYEGEWVRVGMTWKPKHAEVAPRRVEPTFTAAEQYEARRRYRAGDRTPWVEDANRAYHREAMRRHRARRSQTDQQEAS